MLRLPHSSAAAGIAVTVGWAARLALADGWLAPGAAALLAADVLLLAVVAIAGYLLARSRWAHRLLLGVLAFEVAMSATLAWDAAGVILTGAGIATGAALVTPPSRRWVREPPRGGPPPRVVLLLTGLLAAPVLVALASPDGPGVWHWAMVVVVLASTWAYARAFLAGLWSLRLLLPAVGAAAALTTAWQGGAALAAATAALTAMAWRREARLAASPLAPPRVVTYRIPPELAPAEILEAAGLDEAGRPRPR